MIASLRNAKELLQPYSPQVETDELIVALNRWYHEVEVQTYDQEHTEIRFQLPPIWEAMVRVADEQSVEGDWRILNFGCGTGFEASLLLDFLPADSIAELWCYDLSPEMLQKCRERIAPRFPRAHFVNTSDDIPLSSNLNLLATNSVMHHLPSPLQVVESLGEHLSRNAIWLAGHEPSSRYYKNDDCCEVYQRFLRSYRRRRWMSPTAYVAFALRTTGLSKTPAQIAAQAAVDAGLLARRPPLRIVSRLVDLHVAHSTEEANAGRGFDIKEMESQLSDGWALHWQQSYSYMGSFYEGDLPRDWQRESERLAEMYPLDGANFSTVWQRRD